MKSFTDPITLGQILEYEQPTKYIVKSENYDDSYATPVLTPGQTFILGYTDEKEGIYSDPLPVIIFDDFTTATKLVNFPFKVKSSAMKILKPANKNVYIPYWYYYLSSLKVDNDLHKRYWISTFAPRQVNSPSFTEQKRIAERLDKVQELIALQKEQLKKLDELIKSRFIDLFGDPETNTKHWPLISWDSLFSVVTGKLDANAMEENGKYPFFTCAKESFRINSYAFDQKALLLAGNNATADYDVKFYEGKFNAYQRTYVILLKNEQRSYIVYKFLLEQKLQLMKRLSKGTNTRYLTLSILKDFKFLDLPIPQQTQFADFVAKIEAQKGLLTARLSHLETLYKSLMQEYFG